MICVSYFNNSAFYEILFVWFLVFCNSDKIKDNFLNSLYVFF